MPTLDCLRVTHADRLVAVVGTPVEVERSHGLPRELTHCVVLLDTSLVEQDLKTGLRVALISTIHFERAVLLREDLSAKLTGLLGREPVVHSVGVVIVVGI